MAGAPQPDDVSVLREQLLEERATTVARMTGLIADLEGLIAATTSVSIDDEHDPEGSTIAFERSQLAALLDLGRRHMAELEGALQRLDAGSYGRCESCGRTIAAERLAARPSANTCIGCAGKH
jgi:DnaK suppressor protein